MKKPTLYVIQDGAMFYAYRDSACKVAAQTWRYKIERVIDGDIHASIRARKAFVAQAEFAGWFVEFQNPIDLED